MLPWCLLLGGLGSWIFPAAHGKTNARQEVTEPWNPLNVRDLHRRYNEIFRHGNRNAASHLWSSFVLQRSHFLTAERFELMFSGFCAVSGSPVNPSDYNRYGITLRYVPGHEQFSENAVLKSSRLTGTSSAAGTRFGYFHYCCWPCVCDTQDFFWVDTKTVRLKDGVEKKYHVAVLGNPCEHEDKLDVPFIQPFDRRATTLRREAAEIRCDPATKNLIGATLSDHGFIIFNLHFDDSFDLAVSPMGSTPRQPGRLSRSGTGKSFQHEGEFEEMCQQRAASGYASGMGEIFRKVAGITPIEEKAQQFVRDRSQKPGLLEQGASGEGHHQPPDLEESAADQNATCANSSSSSRSDDEGLLAGHAL